MSIKANYEFVPAPAFNNNNSCNGVNNYFFLHYLSQIGENNYFSFRKRNLESKINDKNGTIVSVKLRGDNKNIMERKTIISSC